MARAFVHVWATIKTEVNEGQTSSQPLGAMVLFAILPLQYQVLVVALQR